MAFIEGFTARDFDVAHARIHAEIGGSGPPLLLLHGYPETHVAWHKIAPTLAQHFSVVAPDLRGYGDSTGPRGDAEHTHYSKRAMAQDMLEVMHALGHTRFAILGHDRGARVGYRLCLDHPEAALAFSSLTVIPTEEMWKRANMAFGMKAYHWYLFAQPGELPARVLAADPAFFLDYTLPRMVERQGSLTPEVLAECHRAIAKESVQHAMIEDYRAGATTDIAHDREDQAQGRRVACPVQILWSASSRASPTPLEVWRDWAVQAEGQTIDCGHMMAEEAPDEVLAAVLPFLLKHGA